MNASGIGCGVSGYEERRKRKGGSVKWSTLILGRRNLGGGSVMEVSPLFYQLRVGEGPRTSTAISQPVAGLSSSIAGPESFTCKNL